MLRSKLGNFRVRSGGADAAIARSRASEEFTHNFVAPAPGPFETLIQIRCCVPAGKGKRVAAKIKETPDRGVEQTNAELMAALKECREQLARVEQMLDQKLGR